MPGKKSFELVPGHHWLKTAVHRHSLWQGFYAKFTRLFTDCKVFKYRHLMVQYV